MKYELRDADNKNVLDKQQTIEFVMGDESVPSALERVVGLMHRNITVQKIQKYF